MKPYPTGSPVLKYVGLLLWLRQRPLGLTASLLYLRSPHSCRARGPRSIGHRHGSSCFPRSQNSTFQDGCLLWSSTAVGWGHRGEGRARRPRSGGGRGFDEVYWQCQWARACLMSMFGTVLSPRRRGPHESSDGKLESAVTHIKRDVDREQSTYIRWSTITLHNQPMSIQHFFASWQFHALISSVLDFKLILVFEISRNDFPQCFFAEMWCLLRQICLSKSWTSWKYDVRVVEIVSKFLLKSYFFH